MSAIRPVAPGSNYNINTGNGAGNRTVQIGGSGATVNQSGGKGSTQSAAATQSTQTYNVGGDIGFTGQNAVDIISVLGALTNQTVLSSQKAATDIASLGNPIASISNTIKDIIKWVLIGGGVILAIYLLG